MGPLRAVRRTIGNPHFGHAGGSGLVAARVGGAEAGRASATGFAEVLDSIPGLVLTSSTSFHGGFTIFTLVDALTRVSGKLANAGDRSEADAKASALLALAA